MNIDKEKIRHISSWFSIIAGIVTIINFIIKVIVGIDAFDTSNAFIQKNIFLIRLLSFFILQSALMYVSGYLTIKYHQKHFGFIIVLVVAGFSAWLTLFNIQFFLIGDFSGFGTSFSSILSGIGYVILFFLLSYLSLFYQVILFSTISGKLITHSESGSDSPIMEIYMIVYLFMAVYYLVS